ncbi:MAG: tRNA 2-thiocytidine biosynthesis protein TtcA [Syntrophomonadaceae bacterium]|nr:tRNA 2-thiocytidine biosynthesis protein TtcA [Syntrophomonadaceae bacterium]
MESAATLPLQNIERAIITKYRKKLWTKFTAAIRDFELIREGDRIAVAISGGKDSTMMAKLFQELYAHGHRNFELQFIAMDPGYHETNRQALLANCQQLGIPLKIFESQIFRIVDNIAADYPCYMCAKMRRGALYAQAQQLGCNKLALGHHFNDVIETTMLNMFYAGTFKTMLPKLKSANFPGMELIRPLYYVEEQAIEKFMAEYGIQALNCACRVAAERTGNQRYAVKELIAELKQKFPHVDQMIMRAARNVNLDCVLGWQQGGKKYSYLDFYEQGSCNREN